MIMRAMPMAHNLGLPPSGEAKMVAWIRAHPEQGAFELMLNQVDWGCLEVQSRFLEKEQFF